MICEAIGKEQTMAQQNPGEWKETCKGLDWMLAVSAEHPYQAPTAHVNFRDGKFQWSVMCGEFAMEEGACDDRINAQIAAEMAMLSFLTDCRDMILASIQIWKMVLEVAYERGNNP